MYRYFKRISTGETYAYDEATQIEYVASAVHDADMEEVSGPPEKVVPPMTAEEARRKRNRLLASSDWTQMPDSPVDASVWSTYRQALRDVTLQEGFPENIVWPTKPE